MPESLPLVSVIIPTYNRLRYLTQAVGSVLAQTYPNWELIVVDDGSSDGTREHLEALTHSRIKPIHLAHSGNPARLRNVGVRAAAGRYVAFLDSDDLWEPRKLQVQIADMTKHGQAWSYTGWCMIDDAARRIPFRSGGPWRPYSGFIAWELLTWRALVAISSVVADRELVGEIGYFDENERLLFREDFDFCVRLALRARVIAVDELLSHVRDHSGRSTSLRDDMYARSADLFRKLADLVPECSMRRVCRHHVASHLVSDANQLARAGATVRALGRLWEAFPFRLIHARWWVVLAKALWYPFLRRHRAA